MKIYPIEPNTKDKVGRIISKEARKRMGGSTRFKPKHGMKNSPEYRVWTDMLNRCRNPNVSSYKNYGGRGVVVCDRWKSFEDFFEDMGNRPSDLYSIDRIDSNGNYEKDNVHWILKQTQQRNKRNTVRVKYKGILYSAPALAELLGMKADTLRSRIRRGLSIEEIVNVKNLSHSSNI